jgi:hypothetical protein
VPVYVVNDLDALFEQEVELSVIKDGEAISSYRQKVSAPAWQTVITNFEVSLPAETGNYQMQAAILLGSEQVFSIREIPIEK